MFYDLFSCTAAAEYCVVVIRKGSVPNEKDFYSVL